MKRKFLSACLVVLLLASPVFAGWGSGDEKTVPTAKPDDTTYTRWEGLIDTDFLKNVRYSLTSALEGKKKRLVVLLMSPGGYATESLEAARLVRLAVRQGLVVEIHGEGLIASGATFVLAAGTPGKRYISKLSVFLVHPPQVGGGFFEAPACGKYVEKPDTIQQKIVNVVILLMRDSYMTYTGKPQKEVEDWLTCGNEQVGDGTLGKKLGFADFVEE